MVRGKRPYLNGVNGRLVQALQVPPHGQRLRRRGSPACRRRHPRDGHRGQDQEAREAQEDAAAINAAPLRHGSAEQTAQARARIETEGARETSRRQMLSVPALPTTYRP